MLDFDLWSSSKNLPHDAYQCIPESEHMEGEVHIFERVPPDSRVARAQEYHGSAVHQRYDPRATPAKDPTRDRGKHGRPCQEKSLLQVETGARHALIGAQCGG